MRKVNNSSNQQLENAEQSLKLQRKIKKRKQIIKKTVIYVLVLAFIVYALYAYNFKLKNSRWPWQKPVQYNAVDTMVQTQVYTSKYSSEIDVSGYVQAYKIQNVSFGATGEVTAVYVEEGDRVTKGQLLAEVEDTTQRQNVSDAEYEIEKALIIQNSSDRDMELLQRRLDNAKQQLENTKAYANFDGVVVSVSIAEGDRIGSTGNSAPITIIDDSKLKATVEVDEIDIQLVEKGMKAYLTADSAPGQIIEAYVSYIPSIGRYSNQGIGVMDVEIVIDDPPKSLKPGFSFEGDIRVESEQEMLLVSQSAVKTSRGISTVTKLNEDGTTETVNVTVKYLGENLYQILDGDIKSGDTVVYTRSGTGIQGLMNSVMNSSGFDMSVMSSGSSRGAIGGFNGRN